MPRPAPETCLNEKGPRNPGGLSNLEAEPTYSVTALSIAMLTPGPMVELSATFFM